MVGVDAIGNSDLVTLSNKYANKSVPVMALVSLPAHCVRGRCSTFVSSAGAAE